MALVLLANNSWLVRFKHLSETNPLAYLSVVSVTNIKRFKKLAK
jgi:hypothetical protein